MPVCAPCMQAWETRVACVDSSVCMHLCSCMGFDCCVACLGTYVFCTCETHVWGITYLSSLRVHVGRDSVKQCVYGVDISLVMCVGVRVDEGFLCGRCDLEQKGVGRWRVWAETPVLGRAA